MSAGNFVRIPEAEYNSRIAAAEARGRASASTVPTPVTTAASTHVPSMSAMSDAQRREAIAAIPLAKNHPDLVAKLQANGTSLENAQWQVLGAEGAREAHRSDYERAGAGAQRPTSNEDANVTAQNEGRAGAIKITRYIAQAKTMEGRDISSAQAAIEMERQGLL